MATSTPQFVGRESELHALEQLLGEARQGRPRFVLLSGEPGIGKSSLLSELTRRAAGERATVLEGRATELERVFPFGLFVDAFDGYLDRLDQRARSRLAQDDLGDLASVFPALRSLRPRAAPPSSAAERFRAHRAARELIERIAARTPLLLIALDDVHWADGASIELLGHLLRRAPDAAVVVAMTARSGQLAPALATAINEAVRDGTCRQLALEPLGRDDAGLLVGDGQADVDRLYAESGGNPFFLLQLARTPEGLPQSVSDAIAAELGALPDGARVFARGAAVAGDPFVLDVALGIVPLEEADALTALDELVARDVVRPDAQPRRFRFRHPLVRKAIYSDCPPGLRLVAHERAADLLATLDASPTERAHHVAQSARRGDRAAVELLRDAGLEAARRAPSSAAAWFEAALRIMPPASPAEERANLLVALAGATAATGRLDDSRKALLEALELNAGNTELLVSACARTELLLGRIDDAARRLRRALDTSVEPGSSASGRLLLDLALNAFYAGDYEAMRDWAQQGLDTAQSLGENGLLAGSLAALAAAESATGPIPDAQAHCSDAAALIDVMSDDELAPWMDALTHLGGAEYCLDRFDLAAAHAERGIAIGRGELFPGLAQTLAGALFSTGRLEEASEVIESVIESARLSDNAVALTWGLVDGAYVALAAGDAGAALRIAQEAKGLVDAMGPGVLAAWAGGIRAAALIDAGEPEEAVAVLVAAGGGEALPRIPGGFRTNFLEILTRAQVAAGRLDDAKRTAQAAADRAESFGLDFSTAVAERACAAVALAAGDAGTAARLAGSSADRAEAVGARLEAAASRLLAGRALVAAGETEPAVDLLERAAEAFAACGADRRRMEVERDLRALGRGPYRRSAPGILDAGGLASLTGREREVADLVAGGRTNPQIAAELFLSIKTVETHMRNIFRKLGVGSRSEVARLVADPDVARSG